MMMYLPLFFALIWFASLAWPSWKVMLGAVALEFFLVGLIFMGKINSWDSYTEIFHVFDLLLLRPVIVVAFLFKFLKKIPSQKDFIKTPKRMVFVSLALFLWILCFAWASQRSDLDFFKEIHLAVALASVLGGILILVFHSFILGQILGVLTIETGIALMESLYSTHEHGLLVVTSFFVMFWSVDLFKNFMKKLTQQQATRVTFKEVDVL